MKPKRKQVGRRYTQATFQFLLVACQTPFHGQGGLQGLQPATDSPIADLRRTVDRARCTASRRGEENSNVTLFLIGAAISAIGTEAQNHCGWATATLMACAASAVAVSLQLSRRVSK